MESKQTGLEQAYLITEMTRSFALLTVAEALPGQREIATYALSDLARLTAELQASGFLPQTYSPTTSGAPQSGPRVASREALAAAKEYLSNASTHLASHVRTHGIQYLFGQSMSEHPYLQPDQRMLLQQIRETTVRVTAQLKSSCDKASPSYDARGCAAVTQQAVKMIATPPGPGATWQNWAIFVGVGAAVFYYLAIRRS